MTADALISITGTQAEPAQIDARRFGGNVLRLIFDDVPFSVPWLAPDGQIYTGPTFAQVAEAVEFARRFDSVAVHCLHGRSRSAAITLAILADRCMNTEKAVDQLLNRATARVHPNPGITFFAEKLLGQPHLDAILSAECPDYRSWRAYWLERGWDPRLHSEGAICAADRSHHGR